MGVGGGGEDEKKGGKMGENAEVKLDRVVAT